ncbi:MAG: PAS domain-containing protein [Faecousia sp.]
MNMVPHKPKIGRAAVKEGFDNLPSGICFADRNGTVILCNRQMHRLCYALLGMDLQHIPELRRGLDAPQPGVAVIDREALLYRFPDNTLWQFAESSVTDRDGGSYTQVQAVDVTELYQKSAELEQENRALEEANARARRLYADIDRIVREKENLALKMRVHDDIGLCLLASRNLLMQDSTLEEYRRGGKRWEQVLQIIGIADHGGYGSRTASAAGALAELIAAAGEIGVRIHIQGELPTAEGNAHLLIVAMRECATNTARHARGSEMTVHLTQTRDADIAVITNNGQPPESEITEGGGLSGLRRRVEAAGGTMTAQWKPAFRLTVSLPGKEEGT